MKISILVPFGSYDGFAAAAVNSIAKDCQEVDFEIIAVFDGFESEDLIKLLGAFPSKIIKIKSKAGVAKSLNEAINASQGEYVFRMDADDLWLPGRLKQQIEDFSRTDKNIVIGVATDINSKSKPVPRVLSIPSKMVESFEPLMLGNFITHPTVAFRGSWIRENPYPISEAEDWAMWLKHMEEIAPLNGLARPITAYRRHLGQTTRKIQINSNDEIIAIWRATVEQKLLLPIENETAHVFFNKKKTIEKMKFDHLLYNEIRRKGVDIQLLNRIMSQRGFSIGIAQGLEIFPKASTLFNFLAAKLLS
jgi:glycosyltransferase involved in cell wall biosynthesis